MKKLEIHSLWYWRKLRGFSETDLANAVNVHMNSIRNWQEKPSIIPLKKANELAKVLEIDVRQIEDEHDYRELDETEQMERRFKGYSKTRLYGVWQDIKTRCCNSNAKNYKYYGGRGISICPEWKSFDVFRKWALENGYNDALTIDRINVDGNYEPSNCRWSTKKEQANNRRNNVVFAYNGKEQNLSQWAKEYNISFSVLWDRIFEKGWGFENAILTPVPHRRNKGRD